MNQERKSLLACCAVVITMIVAICGSIALAVSPVWSDTGTVVSNTSAFSGTSWVQTLTISTMHHGNFTFVHQPEWNQCVNTAWYFSKGDTVGVWENYFGCYGVVGHS